MLPHAPLKRRTRAATRRASLRAHCAGAHRWRAAVAAAVRRAAPPRRRATVNRLPPAARAAGCPPCAGTAPFAPLRAHALPACYRAALRAARLFTTCALAASTRTAHCHRALPRTAAPARAAPFAPRAACAMLPYGAALIAHRARIFCRRRRLLSRRTCFSSTRAAASSPSRLTDPSPTTSLAL